MSLSTKIMVSAVTEGVQVSVDVTYAGQILQSPHQASLCFRHDKVTIENKKRPTTVQLLRVKWEIL